MDRFLYILALIFAVTSCSNKQTIIIDEQVSTLEELSKLDKIDIYSYNDWPLGIAPTKYKDYTTDLIVVKTWQYERRLQNERQIFLKHFIDLAKKGDDILIMFNGIEVTYDKLERLNVLQSKDLQSVDTLKRIAAERIFGEEAKSANLIINTYDLKNDLIKE